MAYHLNFDGVDDYLRLPIISFNRIKMDFIYYKSQYYSTIVFSVSNGMYIYRDEDWGDDYYIGINGVLINGKSSSISSILTPNFRMNAEIITMTNNSGYEVRLFRLGSNTFYTKAILYSLELYNGESLVAKYDIENGSVNDISGNNNHATLVGGTWGGTPNVQPKNYTKLLTDNISFKETLYKNKKLNRSFIENISISDTIKKSIAISKQDNVYTTENGKEAINKELVDSIILKDITDFIYKKNIVLKDTVNIKDINKKLKTINLSDIIITSDSLKARLSYSPNLIGVINLKGKQDLNVYLLGKQDLYLQILGKKELNINLKGDIDMAVENQDFKMYSGETKKIIIEMVSPVDFYGSNAIWELKTSKFSSNSVLIKKDPEITFRDSEIEISLNPEDTEKLNGFFYHQLKIIDFNKNVSIITTGNAKII